MHVTSEIPMTTRSQDRKDQTTRSRERDTKRPPASHAQGDKANRAIDETIDAVIKRYEEALRKLEG